MEDDMQVIEEYIKKGLDKGFNINYIKKVLSDGGHNQQTIDTAANNVMGLEVPDKIKPHIEEVRSIQKKAPIWVYGVMGILLISSVFFAAVYFNQRAVVTGAATEIDEIAALGVSVDDLSETVKTQLDLLKEKDLTIKEKEKIIQEQIANLENINNKLNEQRTRLNDILLDLTNRIIGRMSG